jgi:hypothetical protein
MIDINGIDIQFASLQHKDGTGYVCRMAAGWKWKAHSDAGART